MIWFSYVWGIPDFSQVHQGLERQRNRCFVPEKAGNSVGQIWSLCASSCQLLFASVLYSPVGNPILSHSRDHFSFLGNNAHWIDSLCIQTAWPGVLEDYRKLNPSGSSLLSKEKRGEQLHNPMCLPPTIQCTVFVHRRTKSTALPDCWVSLWPHSMREPRHHPCPIADQSLAPSKENMGSHTYQKLIFK